MLSPKTNNASKTESSGQHDHIQILIQLQDVNYPGSTYLPSIERSRNILKGTSYLPTTKQDYDVIFVRQLAKEQIIHTLRLDENEVTDCRSG